MPDEYTAQHHESKTAEHEPRRRCTGRPYEIAAVRSNGLFRDLVRDKLGLASVVFLVMLRRAAILVPLFSARRPEHGNLSNAMASPVWHGGTWSHPLGTDWQGYDVLARLLYGARTSLIIGVLRCAVRRHVRRARRAASPATRAAASTAG